jgi:hypothetical protein
VSASDISDAGAAGISVLQAATPIEAQAVLWEEKAANFTAEVGGHYLIKVPDNGTITITTPAGVTAETFNRGKFFRFLVVAGSAIYDSITYGVSGITVTAINPGLLVSPPFKVSPGYPGLAFESRNSQIAVPTSRTNTETVSGGTSIANMTVPSGVWLVKALVPVTANALYGGRVKINFDGSSPNGASWIAGNDGSMAIVNFGFATEVASKGWTSAIFQTEFVDRVQSSQTYSFEFAQETAGASATSIPAAMGWMSAQLLNNY